MADETYASFKAQYTAIDAKLDAGVAGEERARVKGEIVGLFKSIETQIAELTQLKEEIKQLVDKWKAMQAVDGAQAPQFQGERPVVHADHIGASTFIEKGWSRLSLGDYDFMVIPAFVNDNHYVTFLVKIASHELVSYDSLGR